MRTRIVIAVSLLLAACGQGGAGNEAGEGEAQADFDDPEVQRVHDRMMDVIAPDDGWERARYLEFDWAVGSLVRSHYWDRWDGEARVEYQADGEPLVAIFPTSDPTSGRVWLGGEELEGEEADTRLQSAYRAHINDSYWLVMPFKWSDPGVIASYLGEQEDEDGEVWEVVELRFEADAGLTPQNVYHAFVNPDTWRMERWHHFSDGDSDPSPSDWTEWRSYGPIELAENRRTGGDPRITFPHLRVETEVPDDAFAPPSE